MAEDTAKIEHTDDTRDPDLVRVYEVGYHILPTVKEEDLEPHVNAIRSVIEKGGGSFIAEGAPALMKLSYQMSKREHGKHTHYDRVYFGWIKFEGTAELALALHAALKVNENVLRFIIFRTVREETRARIRIPALREVRRTDTIKTTPRRTEESTGPVSEVELDKALEILTTE